MWKSRQHVSILLIMIANLILKVFGKSGIWVKKFENCDPNFDYDVKINVTFKINDNKQYADGIFVLKSPMDNNILSNISVEILTGNKYEHLLYIIEPKSCQALHKYLGEFAYELERRAQLIPGLCPIAKGRYQIHNALLNYQKITTLANFPFGNLRFKDIVRRKDNSIYTCLALEAENHGLF